MITIMTSVLGCSNSTGPGETKEFNLPGSGGYRGEPVGNCDQRNADEICREFGYDKALDYSCGTAHTSGGFFGPFDQDVMYCVTCWRD
jgi:hypothetical protein